MKHVKEKNEGQKPTTKIQWFKTKIFDFLRSEVNQFSYSQLVPGD